jgi:hypothetical protein
MRTGLVGRRLLSAREALPNKKHGRKGEAAGAGAIWPIAAAVQKKISVPVKENSEIRGRANRSLRQSWTMSRVFSQTMRSDRSAQAISLCYFGPYPGRCEYASARWRTVVAL